MAEVWKSPRKVEEEMRDYNRQRFEQYMQMADDGTLTRALAIAAMREEQEFRITAVEGEKADAGLPGEPS